MLLFVVVVCYCCIGLDGECRFLCVWIVSEICSVCVSRSARSS